MPTWQASIDNDFHPLLRASIPRKSVKRFLTMYDLDFSSRRLRGYSLPHVTNNSGVTSHLCTYCLCRTVRSGICMCNYPGYFRRYAICQDN